ncbi:GerMN domain-containing protein [Anaerosporobacter faecicola]|uniref:GerMN domain-containing protein n=1 Tax=Anaerosporobacter faecicola TaxID=2718714 RepID=UPI0014396B03|nr:GerMN domain-containing protein [Anaerosporobacter faecicola]
MRKKKILTIVTIASLSVLAVTGCKKKDEVVNSNQVNEVVDSTTDPSTEEIDGDLTNKSEMVEGEATQEPEVEETQEAKPTEDLEEEEASTTKEEDSTEVVEKKQVELPIYTINDETLETEDAIAYISGDTEVTAELIVGEVIKAFEANAYEVEVESVSQDGDTVVVNFMKGSAPVTGVGASVEGATLECISYSLLDNLPTCKKVVFRVDGEAYVSGHIEMEINEPYITGNAN